MEDQENDKLEEDELVPDWVMTAILRVEDEHLSTLHLEGSVTKEQHLDYKKSRLRMRTSAISYEIFERLFDEDSGCLFTVPNKIFELSWLKTLILNNHKISKISDAIEELKNLQTLDLSRNRLTSIPGTLYQLPNLQRLVLSSNELRTLNVHNGDLKKLQTLHLNDNEFWGFPDSIANLNSLESLNLSNNYLSGVSDSIATLNKMRWLNLSHNRLEDMPSAITKLNLFELDLSGNQLMTVKSDLSQIKSLRKLNLSSNLLTDLPESIRQLSNLKHLNLSFNNITTIPYWLARLPELETLILMGNPIVTPPPEVFLDKRGLVDIYKLKAYFRQQVEFGEESLYEAKLLVVGEPGAGKTSLTRKLLDPAAKLPNKDESTEGIDVHTWTFTVLLNGNQIKLPNSLPRPSQLLPPITKHQEIIDETDFRVNVWDFGGQEIYHATHQFFFTRRSLYVVVADAREQKTDFFHWLDLIEHLSDRSPVLIFNNAFQNRHWAINEQQLEAYFPDTFQKPFAFNLADDEAGLAYLCQKIQEHIVQLPHVGDVLPRTWVKVRRALENDTRGTVTQQEFLQLCKDNGFTRTEDALQLSNYLHDLGVILHFQDDPLLKKTVILKPDWGTDAVYRVLDNETVKAKLGIFNRSDLANIWYEEEYAQLHDELLALMMKFQLCYAIPNQKDSYIAPQLLSEQPPDFKLIAPGIGRAKKSLYLRYKYEAFMPKGLLIRFIVAMHPHIATKGEQQLVWRTGVVLEKDRARAEIEEFYHRREIRIRVTGKNMRDLLTIISYQLDELHRPFHRLKFDKLIPCNCSICRNAEEPNFYRLDVLKTRLEHNKTVIECDVPPFETVQIRPLLEDVGAAVQQADLPTLLRTFNHDFNDEEFRTLCLELSINYDNLPGKALEGKQRELLLLLERNGRLPELINLLRQKRPNWNW